MSANATPFEAPWSGPLDQIPAGPDRANEPSLAIDQIQGNIFPGFNKDHQTLLFLRIDSPGVSRLGSETCQQSRRHDRGCLGIQPIVQKLADQATWTNICGPGSLDEHRVFIRRTQEAGTSGNKPSRFRG